MNVGIFPKSLLLLGLGSVFWAFFQVFLRFEKPMDLVSKKQVQANFAEFQKQRFHTIAGEPLPDFLKRFQKVAFSSWELSFRQSVQAPEVPAKKPRSIIFP